MRLADVTDGRYNGFQIICEARAAASLFPSVGLMNSICSNLLEHKPAAVVRLRWLSPADFPAWDAFVSSHPCGFLTHFSSWKKVIESAFPHITGHILAVEDSAAGQIRAGLPLFIVKSWLLGTRLVSIPFASVADPLLSSPDDIALLMDEVRGLQQVSRASSIEIRTFQTDCHLSTLAPTACFKHHWIQLDAPPSQLFYRCSRTAVRRMVEKARKSGIQVIEGGSQAHLHDFYRLFTATRKRLSLPPIPFRFFRAIWEELPASSRVILLAHSKGAPIAAVLGLRGKGIFSLEYSGEHRLAVNSGASQLLYWTAIEFAARSGDRVFHFGRTSASNTGLLAYKRHWGTEERSLITLVDPPLSSPPTEASIAYNAIKTLARLSPPGVYRVLGDFCYRHLG